MATLNFVERRVNAVSARLKAVSVSFKVHPLLSGWEGIIIRQLLI